MICVKSDKKPKHIYIVVSRTSTWVAKLIRLLTKDSYNHASISLDSELTKMYSFGRVNPYNPVVGGFVRETPKSYKRFKNTKIRILKIAVSEETYRKTERLLEDMYKNRKRYHYNYIGLVTAYWEKPFHRENNFYCSEFVREVLVKENIVDEKDFDQVVKPVDFLALKDKQEIFEGYLTDYVNEYINNSCIV